jgi:hypothetical protein
MVGNREKELDVADCEALRQKQKDYCVTRTAERRWPGLEPGKRAKLV